jgi:hypothetical protein
MRRETFLVVVTVAGSSLSWWPVIIKPNLNLPWWLPLAFIAVLIGLGTTLSGGRWLRLVTASAFGTFAGLCGGFAIWWPADGIEASFVPYTVVEGWLKRKYAPESVPPEPYGWWPTPNN